MSNMNRRGYEDPSFYHRQVSKKRGTHSSVSILTVGAESFLGPRNNYGVKDDAPSSKLGAGCA